MQWLYVVYFVKNNKKNPIKDLVFILINDIFGSDIRIFLFVYSTTHANPRHKTTPSHRQGADTLQPQSRQKWYAPLPVSQRE